MVIIEPYGGLCNRMRAINSAYYLAEARGEGLKIIWKCNEELNCGLERLFILPSTIRVSNYYYDKNFNKLKSLVKRYMQKLLVQICTETDMKLSELKSQAPPQFVEYLFFQKLRRPYIISCGDFYKYDNMNIFTPVKEVNDKANDLLNNQNNIIGIHIRRTDNASAKIYSKTEAFISEMKKEIQLDNSVYFFVASDSAEETELLKKIFGKRIITQDNVELNRNTINGVISAYIDLLCLSKTKKIYGSYCSSFSDIASQLNGTNLIILRQDDKTNE